MWKERRAILFFILMLCFVAFALRVHRGNQSDRRIVYSRQEELSGIKGTEQLLNLALRRANDYSKKQQIKIPSRGRPRDAGAVFPQRTEVWPILA